MAQGQDDSPKVALVTGAARRVGRAVALELAAAGMDVAVTFKESEQEAREVVQQIEAAGRRGLAIQADLAQPESIAKVYREFTEAFGSLYALINNASFFQATPLASVTRADFECNMAVNATAPLLLTQAFAPMLAAHKEPGRVVNFIDIHVMSQPLKGYVAYNASKAALKEVTMTLAMELAPQVTVNAIAPGVVAWAESYTPREREQYMKRVPLGRPGTPKDAAVAVRFLVCEADYCTGQILRLDGGRLLT